jgi:drug/metabolite transporter (DMT)-like permease
VSVTASNSSLSEPRWKLGLLLALTSSVLWGVLPIALTVVLERLDPYTLTWYRFATAGLSLGLILRARKNLPHPKTFDRPVWILLTVALFGLTGNYILYVKSLSYTSPTVAQTVGQLGPMILLFGGLVLFKEHFSRLQWIGCGVLMSGLALFFNDRLPELFHASSGFGLGVTLQVVSTVVWAAYGMAQKRLLAWLGPQQILLLLYIGAAVVLLPWTEVACAAHLNTRQLLMLAFCCINTLAAYGAFAEGLKHWEVSRFGAVLSTSPLFTVASMWIVEKFAPQLVRPERLNMLSIVGTLLVVGGSAVCALARRG